MKKLLSIVMLFISMESFCQIQQHWKANTLGLTDNITLRGYRIDTLSNDTANWAGRTRTIPTMSAIWRFVEGRMNNVGQWDKHNNGILYNNNIGIGANPSATLRLSVSGKSYFSDTADIPKIKLANGLTIDAMGWNGNTRLHATASNGHLYVASKSGITIFEAAAAIGDSSTKSILQITRHISAPASDIRFFNQSTTNAVPFRITTSGYGNDFLGDLQLVPGVHGINHTTRIGNYNILLSPSGTGLVKISNPTTTTDSSGKFIMVYNPADSGLYKMSASLVGGGGGSGTVNTGSQYRLAYYANNGSAVSNLTSLTGNRVLISDENGLPVSAGAMASNINYINSTRFTTFADLATGSGFFAEVSGGVAGRRTLTGTTNRLTISNGDGTVGDPVFDISSSYVGQSSITTLGTIGTGVWNGTAIATTYGGAPSGGSTGQVLKKNSGTNYDYAWANESGGSITTSANQVIVGTGSNTSAGNNSLTFDGTNLNINSAGSTGLVLGSSNRLFLKAAGNNHLAMISGGTYTQGTYYLGWVASNSMTATPDTRLYRDAANMIAQRNGTDAQEYRYYNTDNGANDEFLSIGSQNESNVYQIASEQTGTGTARPIKIIAPDIQLSNLNINGAYTFPTSDGTSNQALVTNGSGSLSFLTVATEEAIEEALDSLLSVELTSPKLGDYLFFNGTSFVNRNFYDDPLTLGNDESEDPPLIVKGVDGYLLIGSSGGIGFSAKNNDNSVGTFSLHAGVWQWGGNFHMDGEYDGLVKTTGHLLLSATQSGKWIQANKDVEIAATQGLILTDTVTGTRYRVRVTSGSLGISAL